MSGSQWIAFGLQQAIMWLFPIGLAIWVGRRFNVARAVFFIAAGFYLLNLAIQIPFTFWLWPALFKSSPVALLAATTLTYAVCEESMRTLSFRASRGMRANRTANGALLAGLGHGGTESILFALQSVAALIFALMVPAAFQSQAAAILSVSAWSIAAVGVERIFAVTAHMAFATLIVLAYRRSWLFVPLAIAAHWAIDFTTFAVANVSFALGFALFGIWALLALGLLIYARRLRSLALAAAAPSAEANSAAPAPFATTA